MLGLKDIQKQEFDFLDSIDLLPFILSEPNADNLMDTLEEKFEIEYLSSCKIADEGLFNWVTTDEFLDYVCKRYNITFWERIEYILNTTPLKKNATCSVCRYYSFDANSCLCKGPELERHSPDDKSCDDFKVKEVQE